MNEISKAFLKGNANSEYITNKLADVLRDIMRATAAKQDHISGVMRATENWKLLLQLLERCEEPVSWSMLFERAVMKLRPSDVQGDSIDRALQEVARTGMSLYVENSGFASKKHGQLLDAIRHLEEKRRP